MNTITKEVFHDVSAELLTDKFGTAVLLTQHDTGLDDPTTMVVHPLQLQHFAERFAGVEPAGALASKQVKALSRRLRTLVVHVDQLQQLLAGCSVQRAADLNLVQAKATTLAELAHGFCADLPADDTVTTLARGPSPMNGRKPVARTCTTDQASLI